jgi:hypothetical protein
VHRPDQPCEIQQLPNLHAPGGPTLSFPGSAATVASAKGLVSQSKSDSFARAFGRALPTGLKKGQEFDYKQTLRQLARVRKAKARKANK